MREITDTLGFDELSLLQAGSEVEAASL